MKDTLQIVGCTRKKIWDTMTCAAFYTAARSAYKGRGFLKALTQIDGPWVILSGKYGFVEPSHPICRYDVLLGGEHSISDETLRAQARQERAWHLTEAVLIAVRLIDYPHIECLNCNKTYVEKIRMAFTRNQIHLKE